MKIGRIIALLCFVTASAHLRAQENDFCDAVSTIIRDAPFQFRNIRGAVFSAGKVPSWKCGIKVPGTSASLFIDSHGLFYEGQVFQSAKTDSIKHFYEKYKSKLKSCLSPSGYKLVEQDNFYPGLAAYKKLAFMPDLGNVSRIEDTPAHVTMEVTFSKDIGRYTIVIYIFEH
jgi:hypothetical protein